MKKLLVALIILISPAFVFAEISLVDLGYAEKIKVYEVHANLKENASIDVSETITYDFGNNEKHGIFRFIPTIYKARLGSPIQSLNIRSVSGQVGDPLTYETSSEGDNQVIKIGDPNTLVTGIQVYKIEYTLDRMISSDPDRDRFRWDAIGTGWDVPIENAVIRLTSDGRLTQNRLIDNCYLGDQGGLDTCEFSTNGEGLIVAKTDIPPFTGITLESLFESNTFAAPDQLELFFWETKWYYWLPAISFLVFFGIWYEKGRDPKGRGTIVPMYDPPKGITPYEASIILDDMITKKALPAALISLATQGYIKIIKKEVKALFTKKPEYSLELVKPLPLGSTTVEQKINDLFFTGRSRVELNDLGESFAASNAALHHTAYKEITRKGYYVVSPIISRIIFFALSLALIVLGMMLAAYMRLEFLGFACFILSGIIGLLFAIIMPVKTKVGALAKEELLGLKMYIKTAEIDRIRFHNAPAKSPEKFEELLPYAIIFGLEKEWASEFKDVYKNPPSWYDGNMATFSVLALTHDLGGFSDAAISAAVSSSSGGAGGFAGGGGGGGGGGSW
jgi:uncharacterized membrane protein YgcG